MPNEFVDKKQENREHLNYNSMQEQIICLFEDNPAVKFFFLKTPMTSVASLPCLCRGLFMHSVLVPSYVCAFD